VPPLRERREDIAALVQHFARRTAEEHNIRPKRFDPAALDTLRSYRWRGNIRELRNTVERVMIMTATEVVRVEDLPAEVRGGDAGGTAAGPVADRPGAGTAAGAEPRPAGSPKRPAIFWRPTPMGTRVNRSIC
jgi:two-component system nitrogen regulation response regulator NtrX